VKRRCLVQFLQAVAADPGLQGQCSNLQSLEELVQMAQSAGFAVTARELQLWAHDQAFGAPWWPWADAGMAVKTAFFRGPLR